MLQHLDGEAPTLSLKSWGGDERKPAPRTDAAYSAIPNAGNAGPSVTKLQPDVEVDDWEEACE
jgi:transcriptional repressor NF-X1